MCGRASYYWKVDWILWAMRIGSLAAAAAAGWSFGRTTPQWQEDAYNDTGRLSGNYGGGYRGVGGGGTPGCGIFSAMSGGRWGWGLLLIASFVMAAYAWPHPPGLRAGGRDPQFIFMQVAFWGPVLAFAFGYIPSRLSDKGPVGPLE